MQNHSVSIIIPIYNEEENVIDLHSEILNLCKKNFNKFEIIMVDDGSSDNTFNILSKLKPIKVIKLRKNFGQTAAMDAGIKAAQFEYLITMDGDGQNDPNDIPKMIKFLNSNKFDVVSGWRKKRKDSFMKNFISRGANFLRKIIINDQIHDSGCSLKVYKKDCFNGLELQGELHRFIPALLKARGFKIGEIEVNHRPRLKGKSKYNWKRTVKGFIDMLSISFFQRYSSRPLHLMGSMGFFLILLGIIVGIATLYEFFNGQDLSETISPMMTTFLIITGIQLYFFGLIIDIVLKSYYRSGNEKPYYISEVIIEN